MAVNKNWVARLLLNNKEGDKGYKQNSVGKYTFEF
jgi:hypothetical protein